MSKVALIKIFGNFWRLDLVFLSFEILLDVQTLRNSRPKTKTSKINMQIIPKGKSNSKPINRCKTSEITFGQLLRDLEDIIQRKDWQHSFISYFIRDLFIFLLEILVSVLWVNLPNPISYKVKKIIDCIGDIFPCCLHFLHLWLGPQCSLGRSLWQITAVDNASRDSRNLTILSFQSFGEISTDINSHFLNKFL